MLNKLLRLERPLIVLDLETTGLDADADRIVQIAITMHYPNREAIEWATLVNPEIPVLNTKNHNISDADLVGKPAFRELAPALVQRITEVDIMGYNVQFDIKFMKAEMTRAEVVWDWKGHIIDPLHIYRFKRGHTLSNAYKTYVDPKGFEGAHDAQNDVRATEKVLAGQLNEHQDLPRTVKELSAFCFPHPTNALDKTGKFVWQGTEAAINFGKHRGKLLRNVDRGYLKWLTISDFPDDVKQIAEDALNGIFPTKS